MNFKKLRRKLTSKIRETFFSYRYAFFKIVPPTISKARGLRVLIYHGVCREKPFELNSRFITSSLLAAHFAIYKKYFNLISYSDFKNNNFSETRLNVLVTFDDGYRNNFSEAVPLLEQFSIPAVFFVTPTDSKKDYLFNDVLDAFSVLGPDAVELRSIGFVRRKTGTHQRYYDEVGNMLQQVFHPLGQKERGELVEEIYTIVPKKQFNDLAEYLDLMSADELKILSEKNGFSIGSHTVSHPDLSLLDTTSAYEELETSRITLSEMMGKPVDSIAFPYGNYNEDTLRLCGQNKYLKFFGTEKLNHPSHRPLVIERLTINPFISAVNQAYSIAKNSYE